MKNESHHSIKQTHEVADFEAYKFEAVRQNEDFSIVRFTEEQYPEGALRAQQIQGESYVTKGFVFETALDEYGRLMPELDRSRGSNVEYYWATSKKENTSGEKGQASLRKISSPEGGALEDLAAYRYCRDTIDPLAEDLLRQSVAEDGGSSIKEIAALSKTNNASSHVSFELLREITQESIRNDTHEKWLITFAQSAYTSLHARFGGVTLQVVGEPVAVDVGDERTSDELRLIPTLVEPCLSLDGIVDAIHLAKTPLERKRLCEGLLFMVDGLEDQYLSEAVKECIGRTLKARASKAS